MRVPLQIGAQTGEAASPPVSSERLINGYVEQTPQGRGPTPVYGTPGLVAWSDAFSGSARALLPVRDRLLFISDTDLIEMNDDGSLTALGTLPSGLADIAGDAVNTVVVIEGRIFLESGGSFVELTGNPAASSVEWMSGFFIFTEAGTDQFFIAPQNAPASPFDPLDFDSSDSLPDRLVRARRLGRTLLMFGERTVEFWYYSGDATFPFNRLQDSPLDVGLIGIKACAISNETVFWLGSDLTVRRLDDRTATRISTFAIENRIQSWSDPSLTEAFAYVLRGHLFVVFRNPDGCVVWDQATQLWHERQSYGSDTWIATCHARAFGRDLFGSEGRIVEHGGWEELGATHIFEMVTPWLDNGGERFSVNEVEFRVEAGIGTTTLDPQISLARTEDGETFGPAVTRTMGKQGERFRRVLFGRQGQSRGCAFKARITDPVKRVIFSAYADVT